MSYTLTTEPQVIDFQKLGFPKVDKRKRYIVVIDVETTNGFAKPLIYDIGFAICDKKGNRYYEKSFLINEIFTNQELMSTAYYADKIPMYWIQLHNGEHELVSWNYAIDHLSQVLGYFGVNTISAYNLGFDKRAMDATNQHLTGEQLIFDMKELCIWAFACQTIFCQKSYSKIAVAQGWYKPETANLLTNAEVCYRYIKGDYGFVEDHTGLSDVRIEVAILAHCFRQNKKVKQGINGGCWSIPNKLHKPYTSIAIKKHQEMLAKRQALQQIQAWQNTEPVVIQENTPRKTITTNYKWGVLNLEKPF